MQANSRFAVAIHVMALAKVARGDDDGCAVTSEQMAESVNTNPVVLRRILGTLRDSGLVVSQPGPGGGWRLARPADEITLRDVYRAVETEPLFCLPRREPNVDCAVGKRLHSVLESCFRDAEDAMTERLSHLTLADVISSVLSDCRTGGSLFSQDVKELPMSIV
jgi:Rrf2 family protein